MKLRSLLWAAASAPLLLAGVAGLPATAAEPYSIDTILAQTGPASFLGKGEQQALELAEKAVNAKGGIKGRPVKFVFHDDQTNPQVAVQLATQMIADKP